MIESERVDGDVLNFNGGIIGAVELLWPDECELCR